jgi:hypothetical protein
MRNIEGGCHCRNISYRLVWPADEIEIPVRECSCSFCTKHRGAYTSHREARLEAAVAKASMLSRYRFGTETAEFFVCARCGAVPFATSEIDGRVYAVVNVNTFDDVDPSGFASTVTDFDGEAVESRLERRAGNWIPDVVVEIGR